MTTAEVLVVDHELGQVESWRFEELERAGYAPADAVQLAGRHDVDLHLATELVEKGCEPALALKILL